MLKKTINFYYNSSHNTRCLRVNKYRAKNGNKMTKNYLNNYLYIFTWLNIEHIIN